ncbi:MAG: tetratricopeptide repeat protein [Acidobacteriaceae bacterium]|nr:tetratricopeptide repeat protein [Acidobacteriaceae bacterium]
MLIASIVCLIGIAAQAAAPFQDLAARATAAREANDVPHAIELYKQSVDLNPRWEEGWWYLGSLLYDSDQYAAGRDALKHVVQIDAKAAPAWALLGLCEFETGEYSTSLDDIRRAFAQQLDPQMESVLHYHEALLLTRLGRFDEAVKAYTWFVSRGVKNPELMVAFGLAALRTPRLPKEVAGDPQRFALAGQAAYLTMLRDYKDANETFDHLLQAFPRAHYVHYLYGCFLLAAKPDEAMAELRRELEITPASGAANAMLAWVLLERGDTDAARPYARAAAAQDPSLPLAQYVWGRSLLEDGKVNVSIEHLQLAEQRDPSNIETHMSLATAYSKSARPLDARRERLQTLEMLRANAHENP